MNSDDEIQCVLLHSGTRYWHKNHKLHRDNDLPAVINAGGSKFWYKDDKLHREAGPAIIHSDGTQECWVDGKFIKKTIRSKIINLKVFYE